MIDDRKDVLDNIKLQTPHIETIWFGSSDPSIHHCGPTWLDVIRIVRGLDLQPVNPNTSVPVSRYMHVLCPDYTEF
jgi:hypothetical protein